MPSLAAFLPVHPMLANAVPTWTDKEVLIAVGSTIAAMIPVVLFIVRFATRRPRRRRPAESPTGTDQTDRLQEMESQLGSAQRSLADLASLHAETSRAATEQEVNQQRLIADLSQSLDALGRQVHDQRDELAEAHHRIQWMMGRDGEIWNESGRGRRPTFTKLGEAARPMPILSVLNLKGGVGKTTITANLAAALDHLGYRVLLVDLDLQGSLSGIFLTPQAQADRAACPGLLEEFLFGAFENDRPPLRPFAAPVLPRGHSGLVPTSDRLAYAETNLTIRWLLRERGRDVRFLLRTALHDGGIASDFDVVLLDCPPLINLSCVNALAASDYLLIPVLPSRQTIDRVPVLLDRAREIKGGINPQLDVLGIVGNRTSGSETRSEARRLQGRTLGTTDDEENMLAGLAANCSCSEHWAGEVPLLRRCIPRRNDIPKAEAEPRTLRLGDWSFEVFLELACEVAGRLTPHGLRTPCAVTEGVGS